MSAVLSAALAGCDAPDAAVDTRPAPPSARQLQNRRHNAAFLGEQFARSVVFYAQELTQLDPRSDRAKASWRAR